MSPAALVTGGAIRLGKEICYHLAEKGYDIALHYNTSQSAAENTANEIRATGARCELFKADLADPASHEQLIKDAAQVFESLAVLVNSASVFERGGFVQSDKTQFEKVHMVNLEAPVFLTQAFARMQHKGCVVNMIDAMVDKNSHAYFFYQMTKKSLRDFTKMAAVELGPDIRINGVCPGYILPAEGYGEDYQNKLELRLPLKKIATPQAVAQAVFLMINNPSLTGQILYVDGGESLL